jgi:hypothetical protein
MAIIRLNNQSISSVTALPSGVGGKVLQVVNSQFSTDVSTTSSTASDTGHSASITPSSTSSKIFVQLTYRFRADRRNINSDTGAGIRILRDSTTVLDYSSSAISAFYLWQSTNMQFDFRGYNTLTCIDSPSSTSALTYKVQHNALSAKSVTVHYARAGDTCNLTLMEIAT